MGIGNFGFCVFLCFLWLLILFFVGGLRRKGSILEFMNGFKITRNDPDGALRGIGKLYALRPWFNFFKFGEKLGRFFAEIEMALPEQAGVFSHFGSQVGIIRQAEEGGLKC